MAGCVRMSRSWMIARAERTETDGRYGFEDSSGVEDMTMKMGELRTNQEAPQEPEWRTW